MGYRVLDTGDRMRDKYGPRKGLEGPFNYPNGRVLYYDPREGQYYDPATDFYVDHDEVAELQNSILSLLVSQS